MGAQRLMRRADGISNKDALSSRARSLNVTETSCVAGADSRLWQSLQRRRRRRVCIGEDPRVHPGGSKISSEQDEERTLVRPRKSQT